MTSLDTNALLHTLRQRFEQHPQRHPALAWTEVEGRLHANPRALAALAAMEASGGEPDVVKLDPESGSITFCDCAAESPAGRRSLCYDGAAFDARKDNKPPGSALGMAEAMGIEMLSQEQYRQLQLLGEFDRKTSSWVQTPPEIRAQGGALFCDRRYGQVFVYHNGAQSYYAVRGFRGLVRV